MVGRGLDVSVEGALLRILRESSGMSLAELAAKIPYSKSSLGHFETGRREAGGEVFGWYERACGMSADPITAMIALGRADVDRRSFLRGATYSAAFSAAALVLPGDAERITAIDDSRMVGMGEVQALRGVTVAFQRLDEFRGGGVGRTAISEFLSTDVAGLLRARFASSEVRAQALSAAAELAYLAGFKSHDAGMDGMAQRYYLRALRLAEASGVPGQDGWVLRVMALQGTDIGQRSYSVSLAQEAVQRAHHRVGADGEAVFATALARCFAETGDHRQARKILGMAESRISSGDAAELPSWCAWWIGDRATIANQAAKALRAMGEHGEAAAHHVLATTRWDRAVNRRVYGLTMADVGLARWHGGDHGGAAEAWTVAVPVLIEMQSTRTGKALANIARRAPSLVPVVVESR